MSKFVTSLQIFSYGNDGGFVTNVEILSIKNDYASALSFLVSELKSEKYNFPPDLITDVINKSREDNYIIGDEFFRPVLSFKIHEYKESE